MPVQSTSGVEKVTDISNGNSQKEVDRPDSGIPSAYQGDSLVNCIMQQEGVLRQEGYLKLTV